MEVDADRVIAILSTKVAEGVAREAMNQAYTEALERRIRQLEAEKNDRLVPGPKPGPAPQGAEPPLAKQG